MILLALETATRDGSVAVARDGQVIAEASGDGRRPHAARLPGDALALLTRAGLTLEAVDLFGVCLGPGGFTGLRVGLASVQGLAFAAGRQVVGVSALDALGRHALDRSGSDAIAGVWMDAARGEVFAVRYRRAPGRLFGVDAIGEPVSAAPDLVVAAWLDDGAEPVSRWVGDGALRYRSQLPAGADVMAQPRLAPLVAVLGAEAAAAGLAAGPHALRPIYVRPPDAELARQRRASST